MPEVVTAIELDVPPARAWEVLTDTARWPEWNPVLVGLEGTLRVGQKVKGRVSVEGRTLAFDALVVRADPQRALAWKGPSFKPVQALVAGEHWFELVDLGGGRTRFVHGERFTGVLPHFESLWAVLEPRLVAAYEKHNLAFKRRAEAS